MKGLGKTGVNEFLHIIIGWNIIVLYGNGDCQNGAVVGMEISVRKSSIVKAGERIIEMLTEER